MENVGGGLTGFPFGKSLTGDACGFRSFFLAQAGDAAEQGEVFLRGCSVPWQLVLSDFSYLHYSRVLRDNNQPETAFSVRFGCGAGRRIFSAMDALAGGSAFMCIINKNQKLLNVYIFYIDNTTYL